MKVLGAISARAGSTVVPRKNLRPLGGVPMMAHMFANAKAAKLIDRLILTTEDDEIAAIGRAAGIEVPFKRPRELASNEATGIDVAKHAMEAMDALGYQADIIVHLLPTCPFVGPDKIDAAIRYVLDGFDSSILVQPVHHMHPYRMGTLASDGEVRPFLSGAAAGKPVNRQDLPDLYARVGGLFARRRQLLVDWDRTDFALGKRYAGVLLEEFESINIDGEVDFLFAEFALERGLVKHRA